jgi:hypothetical protein
MTRSRYYHVPGNKRNNISLSHLLKSGAPSQSHRKLTRLIINRILKALRENKVVITGLISPEVI